MYDLYSHSSGHAPRHGRFPHAPVHAGQVGSCVAAASASSTRAILSAAVVVVSFLK